MNPIVLPRGSESALTRRGLLGLGAAGMAGLAFGHAAGTVAAQNLSGEITVQFADRGGALETAVTQAIAALQTANPGAKITVADPIGGAYEVQLALRLNTGRGPDVFLLNSVLMAEIAAAKFVSPLDSYLNGWTDWAQFSPFFKQNIVYNGSVWGLPFSLDTHFLYYRKDLFEQAGLPTDWAPKTVEEIVGAANTVKGTLPNVIPYVLFAGANPGTSTATDGFIPILIANGGALIDGDGKWIIDSCAIRDTLRFYQRVYQTEQIVPQTVMSTVSAADAMRDAFGKGQAAIMFGGSWLWDNWLATDPSLADKIGYVLHPRADGGDPFTVSGFGNAWFINARSKSQELAWAFIAAMNTKEVQIALNLADPHVPTRQDAATDPSFVATPFMQAVVASIDSAVIAKLDPNLRKLVAIVQKATGTVATGDAQPDDAVDSYRSELRRVLGDDHVVEQACQ